MKLSWYMASVMILFASLGRAAERPNVVLIFTDDLGYHDVGCFGSEIPTPHIDSIAREGVRLTDWYVAASVCTPSRYSLLTGRYPQRSEGLTAPLMYAESADDSAGLRPEEVTLATLLRRGGYRTAMIGKWHLGHGRPATRPLAHGFDSFYGYLSGCIDYFTHEYGNLPDWWRGNELIEETGYATDLLTDEAVRFVESYQGERPFFLYVSHLAVHCGKGWDEQKREFFYLNQAKPEDVTAFANVADPGRRVYSAMVKALDDGVGRVLAALRETGLEENTWVIFTSDNGGDPQWGGSNRPLRGQKGQLFEGGIRVPCVMKWPGRLKPGTLNRQPCSTLDLRPTLCALLGIRDDDLVTDGRDISGILWGGERVQRDLFWTQSLSGRMPMHAFRRGRWKYVETRPRGGTARSMLFDLRADPGEREDLAERQPDKLKELRDAHQAIRRSL